jgi:DNA-binding response OmpR family regulator
MPRTRVLIVDDHADAAKLLARLLEVSGFEAREANSGADGLRQFAEFKPHAVLLDLGMPEMSGFEVCRQIRQVPGASSVLIVIVSGYLQDEDKVKAMDAGANYYFVKPADPAKLLALIEQHAFQVPQ